ncbi:MAG: hypothetical protein WC349_04315 [Patescibacteria group bacterium]|jgi:hypothetical protein
MKNKIISIISLGVILNWLSLFFSYRRLPNIDINQPFATGGFPLKIFTYPFPPMGHDWPPAGDWPIFFLNLLIWLAAVFLISFLFGKKMASRKTMAALVISAAVLSLIGIFYIVLKFD